MQVFVTGATGFIGTRLAGELARQGHTVRALSRAGSDRSGLDYERIRIVEGDVLDSRSLQQGMRGCSQVYHLAAYARNWAPERKVFSEVNVEGMRNVFAVARAAGVQRLVLTSTIVTFGPTAPGTVGDETTPRLTPRYYTEYEETKAKAETEALEQAARGFPVVIVNPCRVYGPGKMTEGNSVSRMVELYLRGRFPVLLNGGRNVGNYVFVDDLVRGHILAMEKGTIGQRYILGGENISLANLFRTVDELSGRKHRQVPLPPWLARLYGKAERARARWLGRSPQITPGWIETFLQDWAYSSARAERDLGYTITPLREGLRLTCQWLLERRRKAA